MTLYFLRHASAGQPKKNRPEKDEKRALDQDGIEQCRYIGNALAAMDVSVDTLLSSPLKRATQTASLVGNEIGYDGKMQLEAALRPGASFEDFRALLAKNSKSEAIMVVGHNPNLSEFLSLLISEGQSDSAVDLKKGAVARVELRGKSGTLEWLLTPKAVRTVYASAAGRGKKK
jgi:phosphohistidine phosphatase